LPQPIKILTGLRSREFIVGDKFERRDNETYWQVSCIHCGSKKFSKATQIRRNGIGRCKCPSAPVEPKPAKPEAAKPVEPKKVRYRFPEAQALAAYYRFCDNGDQYAYAEFQSLIWPMAERLCNSRQLFSYMDRSDASQEIFLKVFKAMKRFSPERGRLYSFLCRVLQNRITQCCIQTASLASKAKFVSIDDRENADGAHDCQGMKALNKLALEAWKHGESVSSAPSVHDDDDLPALPDNERIAINWLLETLAVDSASKSSAHHISELEAKFGIPAERGRGLFFKTLINMRRKKILKTRRMASKPDKLEATVS
jgi:DNA-directed RNA polymerase specialized sigma24 family protein